MVHVQTQLSQESPNHLSEPEYHKSPPRNLIDKMGVSQNHHEQTVNVRTGTTGLWNLGRKTVKMALSWKLLTDLAQEGIGVNEVEAQAWTRTWNRETKKGKRLSNIKKGIYCGQLKRDKAYICKMMEIRSSQAREDWVSVRKE